MKQFAFIFLYLISLSLHAQQQKAVWWFNQSVLQKDSSIFSGQFFERQLALDNVPEGLNTLHVYFEGSQGKRSSINTSLFYKVNKGNSGGDFEFWFDNDFKNKKTGSYSRSQVLTDLRTDGLAPGLHNLHIRFSNGGSIWSGIFSQLFFKAGAGHQGLQYEYWWNQQYVPIGGQFSGTELITAINTEGLQNGLNIFNIRFKGVGGMWSGISSTLFFKRSMQSGQLSAEYWFNEDFNQKRIIQGVTEGNWTAQLETGKLPIGLNTLSIRFKSSNGIWSGITQSKFFNIGENAGPAGLRQMRYWFNNDLNTLQVKDLLPGITLIEDYIEAAQLPVGNHTVSFQFKDGRGKWSGVLSEDFYRSEVTQPDTRLIQVISFDSIPAKTFGQPPFFIGAVSNKGLPVTYSIISGPGEIKGDSLKMLGAGVIEILATHPGNDTVRSASARISVLVNKATAVIQLTGLEKEFTGQPVSPDVTTIPVNLKYNIIYNDANANVLQVGRYKATVLINEPNYTGEVSDSFSIVRARQVIVHDTLPDMPFNREPYFIASSATSGLPIHMQLTALPEGAAELNGNMINPVFSGMAILTITQQGNENFLPAPTIKDTFRITKGLQSIVFSEVPTQKVWDDPPFAVSAISTANISPISFSIHTRPATGVATLQNNTIQLLGDTGVIILKALQAGDAIYESATDSMFITVNRKQQVIDFPVIMGKKFGDVPFALQASSNVGLPLLFRVVGGPATVTGGILTLNGGGAISIEAYNEGNAKYLPASQIITIEVEKLNQSIQFPKPMDVVFSNVPITMNATSSSGLPIRFEVEEGLATIDEYAAIAHGIGNVVIKAYQDGDDRFNPAEPVLQSFCIQAARPQGIQGPRVVCRGASAGFSVNPVPGATYKWQVAGQTPLEGSSATQSVTWPTAGSFQLMVFAKGNCGDWSVPDTLRVEVQSPVQPGQVSNMLPLNNNDTLDFPILFSWLPGSTAQSFDLYVWPQNEARPAEPVICETPEISIGFGAGTFLVFGKAYQWQVVSKNGCASIASPINRFVTKELPGLPDLTLTHVSVPERTIAGSTFEIEFTVKNIGRASTNTNQWYDYVYLSTDKDLRVWDDLLLDATLNQSFLLPNQSYTKRRRITLPKNLTGSYYLFLITDNNDAICLSSSECDTIGLRVAHSYGMPESDENNNFKFRVLTIDYPPLPDLVVTSVGVPDNVFGGSQVSVNYGVKNIGRVSAVGVVGSDCSQRGWTDRIFLSESPQFNITNAIELSPAGFNRNGVCKTDTSDLLTVGSGYFRNATVELPSNIFGNYFVYVMANGSGEVFEGPYDNNNVLRSDSINVTLNPPADLLVTNVTVPANALSGQLVQVRWNVENQGARAPSEEVWGDSVWLSTTPVFNRTAIVGSGIVFRRGGTSFEPDAHYIDSFSFRIRDGFTGQLYAFVRTDATNIVFEHTNKFNNTRRSTGFINVQLAQYPDVFTNRAFVPDSVTADVPFTLRWRTNNSGPGAANPSWIDEVFISRDSTFSGSSIVSVAQFGHTKNIPVGQFVQNDLEMTLGSEWANQNIYFFIQANAGNQLYEHGDARLNNRARALTYIGNLPTFVKQVKIADVVEDKDTTTKRDTIITVVPPPVVIPPKPDVTLLQLDIPDSTGTGMQLPVQWQVSNRGRGAAGSGGWIDAVYLSSDTTFSVGDEQLLGQWATPFSVLPQDSGYTGYGTVTLPNNITGRRYLIFVTDLANQIGNDSIPVNNRLHKRIWINQSPTPDLIVENLTIANDTLYAGVRGMVKYSLKNIGTAPVNGDFYDALYVSTSTVLNRGSVFNIGFKPQSVSIAPGSTHTDSISFILPNFLAGNYFITLASNPDFRLYELPAHRSNNTFQIATPIYSLSQAGAADLIVSRVLMPDTAVIGKPITAQYSITNQGGSRAIGDITNALYLAPDNMPVSTLDRLTGTSDLAGLLLEPGATLEGNIEGLAIVPAAGNYFGKVRTNIRNTSNEENLGNNARVANAPTLLDAQAIPLSIEKMDTLAPGIANYYKVTVPHGLDLLVDLAYPAEEGGLINRMYIAYNRIPSTLDHDAVGFAVGAGIWDALISDTRAGSYYIMLAGTDIDQKLPTRLKVTALPFSIVRANPQAVGNDEVNTMIFGGGFKPDGKVELRKNGQKIAEGVIAKYINSTQVDVQWQLANVPLGLYDVAFVNPNNEIAIKPNGLQVDSSSGYQIDVVPIIPSILRLGQSGIFTFRGRNTGNVNIPVVQIELNFPKSSAIRKIDYGNTVKIKMRLDTSMLYSSDTPKSSLNTSAIYFHKFNLNPTDEILFSVEFEKFSEPVFTTLPIIKLMNGKRFQKHLSVRGEILRLIALKQFKNVELQKEIKDTMLSIASSRTEWFKLLNSILYNNKIDLYNELSIDSSNCLPCMLDVDTSILINNFNLSNRNGRTLFVKDIDSMFSFFNNKVEFNINRSLYWDGYIGKKGIAGGDLGWNNIIIEDSSEWPFNHVDKLKIDFKSFAYNGRLGKLAGWSPATYNKYPFIIFKNGLEKFDTSSIFLDYKEFASFNPLHKGYFNIQTTNNGNNLPDTLFIIFNPYLPFLGENGIDGVAGVNGFFNMNDSTFWNGEDGSPGGIGGIGTEFIMAGKGGNGGNGGNGFYLGYGGKGGDGGKGGNSFFNNTVGSGGKGGNGGNGGNSSLGLIAGLGGTGGIGGNGGDLLFKSLPLLNELSEDVFFNYGTPGSDGLVGAGANNTYVNNSFIDACGFQASNSGIKACEDIFSVASLFSKYAKTEELYISGSEFVLSEFNEKFLNDNCFVNAAIGCTGSALNLSLDLIKAGVKSPLLLSNPAGIKALGVIAIVGYAIESLKCGLEIGDCIREFNGDEESNTIKTFQQIVECGSSIVGATLSVISKDLIKAAGDVFPCIQQFICTPVLSPCDPNEIVGPPSFGSRNMVAANATLPYTIHFENDPEFATISAQRVVIRQKLHRNFNPLSFRVSDFNFAGRSFSVPANRSNFTTVLNLADTLGYNVSFTAGVDVVKRELFWVFQTIDPVTGLVPTNPLLGFLPINDSTGIGQGFVNYTIRPASHVQTGDSITATADIFFDVNAPITTNTWVNTIDAVRPQSNLRTIPSAIQGNSFVLRWTGSDDPGGSGVRDFDVYLSENGKPFTLYQSGITDTSIVFTGSFDSSYCFYTVANDNVGYSELPRPNCSAPLMLQMPVRSMYVFTGNGNWNDPKNWLENAVPPTFLPGGSTIVIQPADEGECIMNVPQTIGTGATLRVFDESKLRLLNGIRMQ